MNGACGPEPAPLNLFHVREAPLDQGATIAPGRWGAIVLAHGKEHPFFFREHLLEMWRVLKTNVRVSRLNCAFAFESREQAERYAAPNEVILEVVAVDCLAPSARLDMLWVTWMGEPSVTTERMMGWCSGYWSGKSTADLKPDAIPSWEWLFAYPLRVV